MKKFVVFIFLFSLSAIVEATQEEPTMSRNYMQLFEYGKEFEKNIYGTPSINPSVNKARFQKERSYIEKIFYNDPHTPQEVVEHILAEYLLAIMDITGLGGFHYPDDGVAKIESLLENHQTGKQTIPPLLEKIILKGSKELLKWSSDMVNNKFSLWYTQALLYTNPGTFFDYATSKNLLEKIIYEPNAENFTHDPVGSPLRNKARVTLAKILQTRKHQSTLCTSNPCTYGLTQ